MKLKLNKNQNRREFLIASARNTVMGGLGILGITLGYDSITADPENRCEVNLPCRNCFKLGNCGEDKAVELRGEIKAKDLPDKKSSGVNNG